MKNDNSAQFIEQIKQANEDKTAIRICGGDSKGFYGNAVSGDELNTLDHHGIIDYHPSELVVTVRSGTRLKDLEAELHANNQMLAFEPPMHSEQTTIGGIIACNSSGPRRASTGAARDFVLGTSIINGRAEKLGFGGQVMKNVAGYDASRLMTGAQGCLGVLLDISLKVLPVPESEVTFSIPCNMAQAIKYCRLWASEGKPLSASCFIEDTLYARFSSTHNANKENIAAIKIRYSDLGIEEIDNTFWATIKNQQHAFFKQANLWRVSIPANAAINITGEPAQMFEWNGGLRWLSSDKELFSLAKQYGGHATRYPLFEKNNTNNDAGIFQALDKPLLAIQQRLKKSFDPNNILNPGRLYPEL